MIKRSAVCAPDAYDSHRTEDVYCVYYRHLNNSNSLEVWGTHSYSYDVRSPKNNVRNYLSFYIMTQTKTVLKKCPVAIHLALQRPCKCTGRILRKAPLQTVSAGVCVCASCVSGTTSMWVLPACVFYLFEFAVGDLLQSDLTSLDNLRGCMQMIPQKGSVLLCPLCSSR